MLTDSEKAVVRAVLIHGPIPRIELATMLNLSPSSLTRLVKPFLDRGLLVERDVRPAGAIGRPVRPLDVAPGLPHVAGVKLTGEAMHVAVTDVRAELVAAVERPLTSHDPSEVAAQVAAAIRATQDEPVAAVGVSLGGAVRDGVVEHGPFLGWEDVSFGPLLEAEMGVPVVLENDLVALAEAERWFGLGRDIPGFVVITIGAGIGYALVVHGEVVRSREAGVGLGGHIPLIAGGPLCAEGHHGCAQAMLTSGSIAAQVSGALQRTVDYAEVLEMARGGHPAASAVVGAAADALGRFVALAANFSMQPAAVLAGDGIGLFAVAEARVRAALAADRDPRADPVRLFVDDSGFTAWARGAAAVAIQDAVDRIRLDERVETVPAT